jgi:hypothetical protein
MLEGGGREEEEGRILSRGRIYVCRSFHSSLMSENFARFNVYTPLKEDRQALVDRAVAFLVQPIPYRHKVRTPDWYLVEQLKEEERTRLSITLEYLIGHRAFEAMMREVAAVHMEIHADIMKANKR